MNKKNYIKPATIVATTENEAYLLITSDIDMGGVGDPDAKERQQLKSERESTYGNLW